MITARQRELFVVLLFASCIAIALVLCGCEKRGTPVSVEKAQDQYEVELLFSKDGCSVYRFYDSGRRYFTDCKGSTQWEEQEGKSTVHKQVTGGRH